MEYILNCPTCNNASRSTSKRTNIFGDNQFFTDDTYLNNTYMFVRCPNCYTILDVEQVCIHKTMSFPGITKGKKGVKPLYCHPQCINLNLMEYYQILNTLKLSKEQEINIRSHVMKLENDKRRNVCRKDHSIPYNENELKNLNLLAKLLDGETLLSVEINRYLENFDEGLILLNKNKDDHFHSQDRTALQYKLLKEKEIYVKDFKYSEDTLKILKTIKR